MSAFTSRRFRALNPNTRHAVSPELMNKIARQAPSAATNRTLAAYSLRYRTRAPLACRVRTSPTRYFRRSSAESRTASPRHGYVAILVNTDGDPRRQAQAVETMRPRGIDGLILGTSVTRHDDDAARLTAGLPAVTVSRRTDEARISSVVHDEDDGI